MWRDGMAWQATHRASAHGGRVPRKSELVIAVIDHVVPCRLVPHLGLRVGGQGAVVFAQHHNAATRLFALKFFCSEDAFHIEKQAAMLPVRPPPLPPQSPAQRVRVPAVTHVSVARTRTGRQAQPRRRRWTLQPPVAPVCARVWEQLSPVVGGSYAEALSAVQELRALMPPVEVIEQRPEELAAVTARMPWPLCKRPLPPIIVTEKGESLADFVRRSAPDFFTSLQVRSAVAPLATPARLCIPCGDVEPRAPEDRRYLGIASRKCEPQNQITFTRNSRLRNTDPHPS